MRNTDGVRKHLQGSRQIVMKREAFPTVVIVPNVKSIIIKPRKISARTDEVFAACSLSFVDVVEFIMADKGLKLQLRFWDKSKICSVQDVFAADATFVFMSEI